MKYKFGINKEPLNCLFFFNNTKDIVKPKFKPLHDLGKKVYHDQGNGSHPKLLEGGFKPQGRSETSLNPLMPMVNISTTLFSNF